MNLGTHEEINALTVSVDQEKEGLMTEENARILKFFGDQLSDRDVVFIGELLSGTGKSASTVHENCTPNLVTITCDIFRNSFLNCSTHNEYVQNNPRAFTMDRSAVQEILHDSTTYLASDMNGRSENVNINRRIDPPELTEEFLSKIRFLLDGRDAYNTGKVSLNDYLSVSAGTPVEPKLQYIAPFPVILSSSEWATADITMGVFQTLDRAPVGGVIVFAHMDREFIKNGVLNALNIMRGKGMSFEETRLNWSVEGDENSSRTLVVKRTA